MKYSYKLNNIKCGGCAHSITQKMESFSGVEKAEVDVEEGTVSFEANSEELSNEVLQTLAKMGYTQEDPNLVDTAKSYVSCMVGKVGKKMA